MTIELLVPIQNSKNTQGILWVTWKMNGICIYHLSFHGGRQVLKEIKMLLNYTHSTVFFFNFPVSFKIAYVWPIHVKYNTIIKGAESSGEGWVVAYWALPSVYFAFAWRNHPPSSNYWFTIENSVISSKFGWCFNKYNCFKHNKMMALHFISRH